MWKTSWLALSLLCFSGCAILDPEWAAERKRCVEALPILRAEPSAQYRVIRVIEGSDEDEVAWYACEAKADAVIMTFTENEETTTTVGGGPYFATGRTKTKHTAAFVGRAIKFVRMRRNPASQPYEMPPAHNVK